MACYKVEFFPPDYALFLWQTDIAFITKIFFKHFSSLTIKLLVVFKVPLLAWAISPLTVCS